MVPGAANLKIRSTRVCVIPASRAPQPRLVSAAARPGPLGRVGYAPVDTEALFPRQPGWHAGRQGWFGGLATHLTLFDEATAWLPTGEASLELDPGALVIAMAGYDVGPLRFGQEVAWHRAPLTAITTMGMKSSVSGDIVQLKLLSRNRLAFRLAPGSPHTAYVSLGLAPRRRKSSLKTAAPAWFTRTSTGRWSMRSWRAWSAASRRTTGCGSASGATNAEPVSRVLFDGWFNFRPIRSSPHRVYVGGSIGAVDAIAGDWSAGYQLGAGAGFRIADRTVLGIDYRYVAMPSFTAHTPGISLRYNF